MYDLHITYEDGSTVKRDDIGYANIDRDRVRKLEIRDDHKSILSVTLAEGDKFLYRRRVKQSVGGIEDVCHILGKYTDKGKKLMFAFEKSESIAIKDHWEEGTRWFYPPILTEEETKEGVDNGN